MCVILCLRVVRLGVRRSMGLRGPDGAGPSCVIKSMNPECESHIPPADRKSAEAEGNCVAAMRGGEQPEAPVRSQIGLPRSVNSIRFLRGASLRGNGEACRESGEPRLTRGLSMLERGPRRHSWSENVLKGPWMKIRERRGRLTCVAVRALIVAKHRNRPRRFGQRPGNAGGAKERRKVNA